MPIVDPKYHIKFEQHEFRDIRTPYAKFMDMLSQPNNAGVILATLAISMVVLPVIGDFADFLFIAALFYIKWFLKLKFKLPFKIPSYATDLKDPNNPPPGKSGAGKSEGILFVGNDKKTKEELWLTNEDARTHILYLGTTGSGKTEGLKALASNALTWGSGFIYIDGKADTHLWGSLYSLARRFGRDDDLLVINYMTGNSDLGAPSNSLNPFSAGSASYLSNMLVSLMDDAGDDNAMWKGRAISLLSSLMPALTWKRDNQGLLLDVGSVRDHLSLQAIIRLSRDPAIPDRIVRGLQSYLDTLPGYIDAAFDDEGNEAQLPPGSPPMDLSIPRQQHGYLSMQFTRALQSLGDEYGYIFKVQLADINLTDVVLNRRILVVLIPALEKSGDEAANLGKIVAASLKGMMGSTLGAQVEGGWGDIIENKMTVSSSPFITIFDEVGYYTAQGMAVMAAQARSLGFSLVFAAQDLPAMEKRVKEEARSITGNCNLKIFGKLEDPTDTKEFFEKNMSKITIAKSKSMERSSSGSLFSGDYTAGKGVSFETENKASYASLRSQKQGEAHVMFGNEVVPANMLYVAPDNAKALRVHKFLPVTPPISAVTPRDRAISEVSKRFNDPEWTALGSGAPVMTSRELDALMAGYKLNNAGLTSLQRGALAVASLSQMPAEQQEEAAAAAAVEFEEEMDDTVFDFSDDETAETGKDADLKSFWDSLPPDLAKLREDFLKDSGQAAALPAALPSMPPVVPSSMPKDGGMPLGNIFSALTPPPLPAKPESAATTVEQPPKPLDKEAYKLPDTVEAMLKKTADDVSAKLFADADDKT